MTAWRLVEVEQIQERTSPFLSESLEDAENLVGILRVEGCPEG